MILDVTHHAQVSGWDKWTAIGTIAGAVATFLAVAAALFIGWRDRRAADRAQQHVLENQRARDAREYELDLLLELNRQLANWTVYQPMGDPAKVASQYGLALLLALPDPSELPATRTVFRYRDAPPSWPDAAAIHGADVHAFGIEELARRELAGLIKIVASE